MEKIGEKTEKQFGRISSGYGRVICIGSDGNLTAYCEMEKIDARRGNGLVLDNYLNGASVLFGGDIFAVFRQPNSQKLSVEKFVGQKIFTKIN